MENMLLVDGIGMMDGQETARQLAANVPQLPVKFLGSMQCEYLYFPSLAGK